MEGILWGSDLWLFVKWNCDCFIRDFFGFFFTLVFPTLKSSFIWRHLWKYTNL